MTQIAISRRQTIQQFLNERSTNSGFLATVLTDSDGLPLISNTLDETRLDEMLASAAPLIRRTVQRSNERAGFSQAYEIVINNNDHSKLTCRFFEINNQALILICVVPNKMAYRQIMNQMIRIVSENWAG
jgi:predicted regulator of Ras-like GTPase activity (Roadblock/LC7/MglB family)